jgi:hypothetical protein
MTTVIDPSDDFAVGTAAIEPGTAGPANSLASGPIARDMGPPRELNDG